MNHSKYVEKLQVDNGEEVDFCLRDGKSNWEIVYNPDGVIIYHKQRFAKKWGLIHLKIEDIKSLTLYFLKHRYLFKAPLIETLSGFPTKAGKGR